MFRVVGLSVVSVCTGSRRPGVVSYAAYEPLPGGFVLPAYILDSSAVLDLERVARS
jgi:hypothetical protein